MAAKDDLLLAMRNLGVMCSLNSSTGSIPAQNARMGRSDAALNAFDQAAAATAIPGAVLGSADLTTKATAAIDAIVAYFDTLYTPAVGHVPGSGTENQAKIAVRDYMAAFAAAAIAGGRTGLGNHVGRTSPILAALDIAALQAASNTAMAGSSSGNYGAAQFVIKLKAYADTLYQPVAP